MTQQYFYLANNEDILLLCWWLCLLILCFHFNQTKMDMHYWTVFMTFNYFFLLYYKLFHICWVSNGDSFSLQLICKYFKSWMGDHPGPLLPCLLPHCPSVFILWQHYCLHILHAVFNRNSLIDQTSHMTKHLICTVIYCTVYIVRHSKK